MLKNERFRLILELVNEKGSVRVSDIIQMSNVSDMTIRRDLDELELQGQLKRVHGGAISIQNYPTRELSHVDKQVINIEAKKAIAFLAASLVEPNEAIFIGPGTTMEYFVDYLEELSIHAVTNCLPVYLKLIKRDIDAILLGGKMRKNTQSFVGDIANTVLDQMRFNKMFFSANGVVDGKLMTSTIEEGRTQSLALKHSVERYLLVDDTKINRRDFISFYELNDLTNVITNENKEESYRQLEEYVPVIRCPLKSR